MDDITFDRIAKSLGASSVRRQALRVSIGGILGGALANLAQDAGARKKGKKKKGKKKKGKKKNENGTNQPPPTQCQDATETCSLNNDCCEAELGNIQCKATAKADCAVGLPGSRCCRIAGVPCASKCECCDDLVCAPIAGLDGDRCQAPPS